MFGRKKRSAPHRYDITKKIVKTWWGGTKIVPSTTSEQRKMRAEILKRDPSAIIIDNKLKKEMELDWIDYIEEYDALIN